MCPFVTREELVDMDKDNNSKNQLADRSKRLSKEQLDAIRGGVANNLPDPKSKPVFYTQPTTEPVSKPVGG